jgi:hypothetical protein
MKKILTPLLLCFSTLTYAQYPADFTIKQLEENYIDSVKCNDICGNFTGLKIKNIDFNNQQIKFEIPVTATQLTTVALPFSTNSFNWLGFSLDGKNTNSIFINQERIMVAIPKGVHVLEVNAKFKNNQFRIGLLEDPKYFENNSGVNADIKQVGNSYFLEIENKKITKLENKDSEVYKSIFDKPIYNIQRELYLGEKWKIKTTITPLMLAGDKVSNLSIPLLDGENPLNNDLELDNNKVNVTLTNNQVSWESTITPKDKMVFKNTDNKNLETWKIYNENNWLYSFTGENPISNFGNQQYKNINTWVMWPEEKVEIKFSLPTIAEGKLSNITNFKLTSAINNNPLEHKVEFNVSSSIGGRYNIEFEDKETKSLNVTVRGQKVETSIKDGKLALDLFAGDNGVTINFKSGESSIIYTYPKIKFETPVTNAEFNAIISDRWLLFTGGGDIRPAVLLLGILLAFSLFGFVLNKTKVTPLGLSSWVLLLLGLSQSSYLAAFLIIGWLLAFGYRNKIMSLLVENDVISAKKFNFVQGTLIALSVIGGLTLIGVVGSGLLSRPDVFVTGLRSSSNNLYWYIQSWNGENKTPWFISLPIEYYRIMILSWGVWLAFSLMSWLKWMWTEFSKDGYWRKEEPKEIVEDTVVNESINYSNEDKEIN